MVRPEILNGTLILNIEGMDKLWAFKSQLSIPLQHITGARLDEEVVKEWIHGIRMPGTSIPGVITAGTFYQAGKRVFWDIHHPERAVVISLAHEFYSELIIEVENPDTFISNLKNSIN
ncbi:MAG: hypothetical protein WCA38_05310 [Candidatus Acidiferrales bacterium]